MQTNFFTFSQAQIQKLSLHVVRSEYDCVEGILKKNPEFMLQKTVITDYSKRIFNEISPFMYALWAWDRRMWITMLGCVPCNEQGLHLVKKLIEQYQEVENCGVSYKLMNDVFTESHFNLECIIRQMQEYIYLTRGITTGLVDLCERNDGSEKSVLFKEYKSKWLALGLDQRLLPVNAIFALCCSNEELQKASPRYTVNFYKHPNNPEVEQGIVKSWFDHHNELGLEYTIYKGPLNFNGSWGRAASFMQPILLQPTLIEIQQWHAMNKQELRCFANELTNRSQRTSCLHNKM